LTENKALGSLPVTSANETFWRSFTGKDGNPINITDPATETHPIYTEFKKVRLYRQDDQNIEIGEDGIVINDWESSSGAFIPQGQFPNDIVSNVVEIRLVLDMKSELSTDNTWTQVQLNHTDSWGALGDDVYEVQQNGSYSIILKNNDVEWLKKSGINIKGYNFTLYSVEFRELEPESITSYPYVNLSDIFDLYGLTTSPQSTFDGFKHFYLRPNNTYDEVGFSCGDLAPIVGKGGVFSEEINDKGGRITCNLEEFYEKLKPQDGVDYIISEDNSEVSIDYFFGCASTFNSFGYFYYTDEDANIADESERMKVLLKRPMFLLMYNACPGANILLKE
ncbi:MAG: hypothetical protein K2I35_06680, partial [Duncaniella sp.]|nr:hypothetical protein [Duncaniella sp.]